MKIKHCSTGSLLSLGQFFVGMEIEQGDRCEKIMAIQDYFYGKFRNQVKLKKTKTLTSIQNEIAILAKCKNGC